MTAPLVILADDNLFFRAKIESALGAAGYEVTTVTGETQLAAALERDPRAMLLDVGSSRLPWREMLRAARERCGADFPVIGYGPHVDEDLFVRAREAGCTAVHPNGLVAVDPARVLARNARRD